MKIYRVSFYYRITEESKKFDRVSDLIEGENIFDAVNNGKLKLVKPEWVVIDAQARLTGIKP